MSDDELRNLRRWKAEAMPVLQGLQDVGHALGVPLGTRITAKATVDAALDLRNERDAALAEVDRLRAVITSTTPSPGIPAPAGPTRKDDPA